MIEVRIEPLELLPGGTAILPEEASFGGGDDHAQYEPILVVFSNDRKRRKMDTRELHEIQTHESEMLPDVNAGPEEETIDYADDTVEYEEAEYAELSSSLGSEIKEIKNAGSDVVPDLVNHLKNLTDYSRTMKLHKRSLGGADDEKINERENLSDVISGRSSTSSSRAKRNAGRRPRKSKRNSCRRKPMYINFAEIHWDKWIIAPNGYQVNIARTRTHVFRHAYLYWN